MKCLNCNLTIPDNSKYCPECHAKIDNSYIRCPACFVKIKKGLKCCPKCGCNIEEASEDDFAFFTEKKNVNYDKTNPETQKRNKIIRISVIAVLIAAIAIAAIFNYKNEQAKYMEEAEKCIEKTEQSMEYITELAQQYNEVYDGKWLHQMENISRLEQKNSEIISECRSDRDSLNYMYRNLKNRCGSKKGEKIIQNAFKSYEKCYLYVIEKYGKYPGYMEKYNEIYDKYSKNIKEFNEYIKSEH